jgi:hypothetical protein
MARAHALALVALAALCLAAVAAAQPGAVAQRVFAADGCIEKVPAPVGWEETWPRTRRAGLRRVWVGGEGAGAEIA